MTEQELLEGIRQCRVADLSDGMDALGLVSKGTMSTEMTPIRPGISFAGWAWTVKLEHSNETFEPCSTVEEYMEQNDKFCGNIYSFMKEMKKQDVTDHVLVIDMEGYPGGILGSENMMKYTLDGMVGAVVDGGCRDIYECNLEQVNVFSTKKTFQHVSGRMKMGEIGVPVKCAGVHIEPRDIICADDDGVLVIPQERAEEVLTFARAILQKDQKVRTSHYEALGFKPDETLARVDS